MNEAIDRLTEEVFCELRRAADTVARFAELADYADEIRHTGRRWADVRDVTLVNLKVYAVRRVTWTSFKRGKVKSADKPVLARWCELGGWRDELGYLRSSTASLDGIQVWV